MNAQLRRYVMQSCFDELSEECFQHLEGSSAQRAGAALREQRVPDNVLDGVYSWDMRRLHVGCSFIYLFISFFFVLRCTRSQILPLEHHF